MSLTYNGHTLQEGVDYTYTLSNNEQVSVDSKASVIFTGIGNYTGSRSAQFEVTKVNLAGGTVKLDKRSHRKLKFLVRLVMVRPISYRKVPITRSPMEMVSAMPESTIFRSLEKITSMAL